MIKPIGDKLLVLPDKETTVSAGGILLPHTATEKPHTGEVVAAGRGKYLSDGTLQPMAYSVGSTVIYGKYSGVSVQLDGVEYLILLEDEVLGELNG